MTFAHTLGPQRMLWPISLALLASCVQTAMGADGGLKVQVTQKGLNYAKELGIEILKLELKKETFHNINGSYTVPLAGKVQYSVSGIQVTEFQVNQAGAEFAPGTGVNLSVQDAKVLMSGNWKLASFLGDDSGTIDISIDRLTISMVMGVDRGDEGRLRVWYESCRSAMGDFRLTFYGGTSWLYNIAASALKDMLKSEVNQQLCSEVKKGIGKIAEILKTMNVSVQLDPIAGIDYSLVERPVIDVDRCNVDLKGQFFTVGKTLHGGPFQPAPFLLPNQSDSMVLLGISELVANSAAFVYYTAGALRVNYTDAMVPKTLPLRLNTKNVGIFVPELNERFPNMPMEFHLAAQKEPELRFQPTGVEVTLFGFAEAFVILPNASLASVFLLNIDANLTVQPLLQPGKSGKTLGYAGAFVALKKLRLSKEWSKVGEIRVTVLETLLKAASNLGMSRLNKRLKEAIALPNMYGSSLLNPTVMMNKGHMFIATDLVHQPQAAA
nr:bactericidal permeability-increasing protein-like [Zootoca vivipara]